MNQDNTKKSGLLFQDPVKDQTAAEFTVPVVDRGPLDSGDHPREMTRIEDSDVISRTFGR